MSHFIFLDKYKYVVSILKKLKQIVMKSLKIPKGQLHQTHNKHKNMYLRGFVVKKKYYLQINTTDVIST
jgi:hypothetical protein